MSDGAPAGEEESVGEPGGDFLDVMGDQHEGGAIVVLSHVFDRIKKIGARNGIESGTGFVQHENFGFGGEGPGDEDALTFALRKDHPGALGEFS